MTIIYPLCDSYCELSVEDELAVRVALDSGPVLPEQSPIPRDAIAGAAVQLADAVDQTSDLLMAATDLHRKVADLHATLTEALVDLERVLAESTTDPST